MLEHDVDERAAFECGRPEPLVEDVEDREQLLLGIIREGEGIGAAIIERVGTSLEQVRAARGDGLTIPLAVMTYVNPVLSFGVDGFARETASAGVDGVILPDLPLDEAAGMRDSMHAAGVAVIPLVAPTTTPERLARICAAAAGFVYCVGVTGVTGARRSISDDAIGLLESVRRCTPLPRALGFGLSTPAHLVALRGHAEAAVVGSALLDSIAAEPRSAVAAAERFLRTMMGVEAARGA